MFNHIFYRLTLSCVCLMALMAVACPRLDNVLDYSAVQREFLDLERGIQASNDQLSNDIVDRDRLLKRFLDGVAEVINNEEPLEVPIIENWERIWDYYNCSTEECPEDDAISTRDFSTLELAKDCLWRTSYCVMGEGDSRLEGYTSYAQAYSLWERKYVQRFRFSPFGSTEQNQVSLSQLTDQLYFNSYFTTIRVFMRSLPDQALAVLGYSDIQNTGGDFVGLWYAPTRPDIFGCVLESADFASETNASCLIPRSERNSKSDPDDVQQAPRVQFIQLDCPTGGDDDGSFKCVNDANSIFGRVLKNIIQFTSSADATLGNRVSEVPVAEDAEEGTQPTPAIPYVASDLSQEQYLLLLSGPVADGTLEDTYSNWEDFRSNRPDATVFTSLVQRNSEGQWETTGTEATCTQNLIFMCLLIPTVTFYDENYTARTDITVSSSAIASAIFASIFAIWPYLDMKHTVGFVLNECLDSRERTSSLIGTKVLSLECLTWGRGGDGRVRLITHSVDPIPDSPIFDSTLDPATSSFTVSSSLSVSSFERNTHDGSVYGVKAFSQTALGVWGVYASTQRQRGRLLDVIQLESASLIDASLIEQSVGVALGGGYHFSSQGWGMGLETALVMMSTPLSDKVAYGWRWEGSAFFMKTFPQVSHGLTFTLGTSCASATRGEILSLEGTSASDGKKFWETLPSCGASLSAKLRF